MDINIKLDDYKLNVRTCAFIRCGNVNIKIKITIVCRVVMLKWEKIVRQL